jgi:hypothetical protein
MVGLFSDLLHFEALHVLSKAFFLSLTEVTIAWTE